MDKRNLLVHVLMAHDDGPLTHFHQDLHQVFAIRHNPAADALEHRHPTGLVDHKTILPGYPSQYRGLRRRTGAAASPSACHPSSSAQRSES